MGLELGSREEKNLKLCLLTGQRSENYSTLSVFRRTSHGKTYGLFTCHGIESVIRCTKRLYSHELLFEDTCS